MSDIKIVRFKGSGALFLTRIRHVRAFFFARVGEQKCILMLITCHQPGVLWSRRQKNRSRKEENTSIWSTRWSAHRLRHFGCNNRREKAVKRGLLPGKASSFCWLYGLHSQWAPVSWQRCYPGAAPPTPQQPITRQLAAHSRILGYFRSQTRARTAVLAWPSRSLLFSRSFLYNVLPFRSHLGLSSDM